MTPKKYPQNFIPQKFLFFLKTQKNIEIQNFEPQKMDQAYVCMKISEDPPPGPPPPPPPHHHKYLDLRTPIDILCLQS